MTNHPIPFMFYQNKIQKFPHPQQNSHDPSMYQHPKRITLGNGGVTARMLVIPLFSGIERCLRKWWVKRKDGYLGVFIPILFYRCFTSELEKCENGKT